MIKIERNKELNMIKIKGHASPEVCSSVSSIMYTSVNALLKYNKCCITFNDDTINDEVTIILHINDKISNMLFNNMFDMFKDLCDTEGLENQVTLNTV